MPLWDETQFMLELMIIRLTSVVSMLEWGMHAIMSLEMYISHPCKWTKVPNVGFLIILASVIVGWGMICIVRLRGSSKSDLDQEG